MKLFYEKKITRLENYIETVEKANAVLIAEAHDLKQKNKRLELAYKTNPKDRWYLVYLLQTIAELERTHEQQNKTIGEYSDHFKRFEHYVGQKVV